MRILLSDTWAGGGASTFVAVLARGLQERGHEVDVVLGYRTAPAVEVYRPYVRKIFAPPSSFSEILLRGDYDAVHITEQDLFPPFDYARRARRLGVAAIVATSHTTPEDVFIPQGAAALVFVSEHGRLSGAFAPQRVEVIPNGVDAHWLRSVADDALVRDIVRPLVVWAGRLVENPPQKDFLGFGYALRTLVQQGWQVLVLDGSPLSTVAPADEQLRRWFGDAVRYANQVPMPQVLGALRRAGETGGALVSTSRVEGAPFIALEALALGCPIVAPPIAGYERLLELGSATTYESLEDLLRVLGDGIFGGAAVALPEELTAERMVDAYLALYAELASDEVDDWAVRGRRTLARVASHPAAQAVRSGLRVGRT